MAGFAIYRYYYSYSALPQALTDHLLSVVNQFEKLKITDIDFTLIDQEAKHLTYTQLRDDLTAAGMPDPDASAVLLFEQATGFLDQPKALLNWVTIELHDREMPTQLLEIAKPSLGRWEIISNGECLVIEKKKQEWQLVSLLNCKATNAL